MFSMFSIDIPKLQLDLKRGDHTSVHIPIHTRTLQCIVQVSKPYVPGEGLTQVLATGSHSFGLDPIRHHPKETRSEIGRIDVSSQHAAADGFGSHPCAGNWAAPPPHRWRRRRPLATCELAGLAHEEVGHRRRRRHLCAAGIAPPAAATPRLGAANPRGPRMVGRKGVSHAQQRQPPPGGLVGADVCELVEQKAHRARTLGGGLRCEECEFTVVEPGRSVWQLLACALEGGGGDEDDG